MKVPLLDLKPQFAALQDDLMTAVSDVLDSQRFIMGPSVPELESAIAEYCGAAHGVACASGTDALLLPLMALGLEPGDEVVTTPFTFFGTAGAIVNAGGRPVFADVDPATLNIDPNAAQAATTDRTRAVIPVHLFGQMAPMSPFLDAARATGHTVIEDACQAIGARQLVDGKWRHAGELGTVAAFSFFPSKNLGGWGDGGMMVTSDGNLASTLRLLRTHGGARQYHHEIVGTNSRLDTLQASILLVKLARLETWNAKRRENASRYSEAFADVDEVTPLAVTADNEAVFHQYTVRVQHRDALTDCLKMQGIGHAVYYPTPLHLQPCFAHLGYAEGSFPVTEQATREVLSLPIYPELPDEQRETVVDAIRTFYR